MMKDLPLQLSYNRRVLFTICIFEAPAGAGDGKRLGLDDEAIESSVDDARFSLVSDGSNKGYQVPLFSDKVTLC